MWASAEDEEAINFELEGLGVENSLVNLGNCQLLAEIPVSPFALDCDEGTVPEAAVQVNTILPLSFTAILIESAAEYATHQCY